MKRITRSIVCADSCVKCLSNLNHGTNYPGHRGFDDKYPVITYEDYIAMMKPELTGSGHAAPAEFSDHEFKREYPRLYNYFSDTKWDDGTARKTTTLLLFLEAGMVKLCLNDRATNRQAFISARTLTEALTLADEGLSQDSVDWRPVKAFKR